MVILKSVFAVNRTVQSMFRRALGRLKSGSDTNDCNNTPALLISFSSNSVPCRYVCARPRRATRGQRDRVARSRRSAPPYGDTCGGGSCGNKRPGGRADRSIDLYRWKPVIDFGPRSFIGRAGSTL